MIKLKPLQNKKDQKNLRYPPKEQSFSLEKDCFFVGYPKYFWPFLFWNGLSKVINRQYFHMKNIHISETNKSHWETPLMKKLSINNFTTKLHGTFEMDPYIKITKKFTKKSGSKVINLFS